MTYDRGSALEPQELPEPLQAAERVRQGVDRRTCERSAIRQRIKRDREFLAALQERRRNRSTRSEGRADGP
jgi:hypothetical protein